MIPDDQIFSARRIRWACRRGMLELDLLLNRYLDQSIDSIDHLLFFQLLQLPDAVLFDALIKGDLSELNEQSFLCPLIQQIRNSGL